MDPLVCAVMLTRDRPEMAARAVRAFREQTYQNKRLVILDTGNKTAGYFLDEEGVGHRWADLSLQSWSISRLRNEACHAASDADIFIHWDDDDVSHPNRIAEQVAHLQASGADVVGYDEVLFWRTQPGEAWLYSHNRVPNRHAPGSSFCYWRKAWEKKQFNPQLPRATGGTGEDYAWLNEGGWLPKLATQTSLTYEPRLICSIHGGNTMPYDDLEKAPLNWRRAPEWDAYCAERMRL